MQVIVVGGGVMGLLTADMLARRGAQVLLLEQDDLPSPAATSYDEHRIIRSLHLGEHHKSALAAQAERAWLDLQARLGGEWYHRVGALTVLPKAAAAQGLATLRNIGIAHEQLTSSALAARFPLVNWPRGRRALFEPHAGILLADRALHALAAALAKYPNVELYPHHRVQAVDTARVSVRLTDGREWRADKLVLTAGPWSQMLLPSVPSVMYRQLLAYARPVAEHAQGWSSMPAVPSLGNSNGAWLIPPIVGTHLKLTAAAACCVVPSPQVPLPATLLPELLQTFQSLLRQFEPSWVTHTRTCTYLAHPRHPHPHLTACGEGGRVVALTACGGSAFKFAPLLAAAIANRILGSGLRPRRGRPLNHQPALGMTPGES